MVRRAAARAWWRESSQTHSRHGRAWLHTQDDIRRRFRDRVIPSCVQTVSAVTRGPRRAPGWWARRDSNPRRSRGTAPKTGASCHSATARSESSGGPTPCPLPGLNPPARREAALRAPGSGCATLRSGPGGRADRAAGASRLRLCPSPNERERDRVVERLAQGWPAPRCHLQVVRKVALQRAANAFSIGPQPLEGFLDLLGEHALRKRLIGSDDRRLGAPEQPARPPSATNPTPPTTAAALAGLRLSLDGMSTAARADASSRSTSIARSARAARTRSRAASASAATRGSPSWCRWSGPGRSAP